MTVKFFGSGTGDPVRLQRRLAWQTVPEVPSGSTFYDFLSNGGPVAPAPAEVVRQVIRNSAMRQPSLEGKYDVADSPLGMGDLDPTNKAHLMLWANFLQGYRSVNLSGGAFRHYLSQIERSANVAPLDLTLLSDNDTGLITRWSDVKAKALTLTAAAKANLAFQASVTPGKFDFAGDPTQTAGSGSTIPFIRHTWPGQFGPDATDADIYVEITTVPVSGVGGLKVKVGAAASFAGAEIPFTLGEWTYLNDQLNALLGQGHGEQVQFYEPVGATLTVNDIFKIPKRRLRWAPSYPLDRPIPEINLRAYFGGREIAAEGGYTLTGTLAGVTARESTGGRQRIGTQRIGFADVQLQLVRRLVDLDLQTALLQSNFVSFVVEALTDVLIPSTSVYYGWRFVMPFCRPIGTAYDVAAGGATRDETIVFKPYEAPDNSFLYNGDNFQAELTAICDTDVTTVT